MGLKVTINPLGATGGSWGLGSGGQVQGAGRSSFPGKQEFLERDSGGIGPGQVTVPL